MKTTSMEFLCINGMYRQIRAVQQMRTRKEDFGRYIGHGFFSLTSEAERPIQKNHLDIDAVAREMAYDFYEKDHCQVIYAIHRLLRMMPIPISTLLSIR